MLDFSKASVVKKYLYDIIEKVKSVKVKAVFSICPAYHSNRDVRIYSDDCPIYILFENDDCLVIDYRFIDAFQAEFRKLTDEEQAQYEESVVRDYFNCTIDIHDAYTNEVTRTETIVLEYGSIERIVINHVINEYQKWIDGDIDFVAPSDETFDKIKFIMSNGNSFTVCADEADVDGYMLTWSDEAKETIVEK